MRFALPASALTLLFAVSSSMGLANSSAPDPRAMALAEEGRARLAAADPQGAIDALEAALVIDPAYTQVYLQLAEAARAEGLQGKAIHFYRAAQERDPDNLAAIFGEGEALVEKGALAAARETLAELATRCGDTCPETRQLAAAIDRGPPVLTAEAVAPDGGVAQN